MFLVTLFLVTALIFLVIFSGFTLYRWVKSVYCLINSVGYWVTYGIITVSITAVFFLSKIPNTPLPRFIIMFGYYGLGFFLYFILFINLISLILFILKGLRVVKSDKSSRACLSAVIVCFSLVIGISTYGMINASDIDKVSYSVTLDAERAENTKGFKIALISDLHLGHSIGADRLEEIVGEINKTDSDIVCIAGDIFDGDMTAVSEKDRVKEIFRSIKSNFGVYACFGNHDAGDDFNEMAAFIADSNITLLEDEYRVIDSRLILVGRRDSSPIGTNGIERKDVILPQNNTLPVIVLDHQPGNIGEYGSETDLILSGHTHLGQMIPFNIIVNMMYDASYGYYRADESSPQVIVSSGVGTWGPALRIGSDNEIVEIVLN